MKGSKAGGKKVEVKTGNNLSIESLQDSHTYHSRDKESGIHLQRDITARPIQEKEMDDPYFSIGKKTDTTDPLTKVSQNRQVSTRDKKDTISKSKQHPPQRSCHRQQSTGRKEQTHHRYFGMGKHRQQSGIQNRRAWISYTGK
ncbi:MAG: hemagglutinin repeat-containing protein [Dialister invisus]